MARRNDGNSASFCRPERDRVASFRSFITANRRRERRGNHPAHSISVLDAIDATHPFATPHASCSTLLPCDSGGHPCFGECHLLEPVPVPVGTGMPPSHRGTPSAAPEGSQVLGSFPPITPSPSRARASVARQYVHLHVPPGRAVRVDGQPVHPGARRRHQGAC